MVRHGSITFEGCCARLGVLSAFPPQLGHPRRFRISRDEADKAIASLKGTPLTRCVSLKKHGNEIVGCITEAWTTNTELLVRGSIWTAGQQTFLREVRADKIGLSIEAIDANFRYNWMRDFKFNGVAALYRDEVAFPDTWIKLPKVGR